VGEEEHAQGRAADAGEERARIERIYGGYRADHRKHRAWSGENVGNACIREEVLAALLELLPQALQGDGLLLDVGCGGGWWLERLREEGVPAERLVGADLLEARVQAARERVPGARVMQGDARRLELPDASCSLVLLLTVLSTMGSREDVRSVLAEARRVLAPEGAIAVWEPRIPTPNRHTRLIRISELRATLGRQLDVRSLTLAPPIARRGSGRLYRALARVPALRTHRLIIARPHAGGQA
jgi:SAM-dependent methyltransferase